MATHALSVRALSAHASSARKRVVAAITGLGALAAPSVALACPYCATRSGGGIGPSVTLGVFLALPFVVAGVIYTVLRREAE